MWTQSYQPVANSLALSTLAAAMPLVVLGLALAVWRLASWKACLLALATSLVVATGAYGMPVTLATSAALFGAVFGLFPLGYLVFAAILLFDLVVASGRMTALRQSLSEISPDIRIQALVIAFGFGAFLEGATGAGTPVAVTASILTGIGFTPLMAAAISLLANTAPVAFGALGLPVLTLASVTGLPVSTLSSAIGRICPIIAVFIPAYLVVVMAGGSAAFGIWPALAVSGIVFAGFQFLASNFLGPYLPDIVASLATLIALITLLRVWRPKAIQKRLQPAAVDATGGDIDAPHEAERLTAGQIFHAWSPYLILVVTVVVWGLPSMQRLLDRATLQLPVPMLHDIVRRTAPIVAVDSPYPAVFAFNWLGAAGTACLIAAIATTKFSQIGVKQFFQVARHTGHRLLLAEGTIAAVLAIAFVMNYSGATATLGLATATTGRAFPFFSAFLGWVGVFLTGSDTSANALFGPLQVISAQKLHLNPVLTAAVNTCGGVMGKMISIQSIAVAAAATGMPTADEGRLFRLTLKHSIVLTAIVGLIALGYAYVAPAGIPSVQH